MILPKVQTIFLNQFKKSEITADGFNLESKNDNYYQINNKIL